jgi:CheY-like chemotaxis protein
MPKVDGQDVLRQIKEDERLSSIPVVMFTSSREESDLVRCYRLGANAYVVKPVDFQEFSRAIRLAGEFWTTVNEPVPESPPKAAPKHPQLANAA